jgi:hypothetical protein
LNYHHSDQQLLERVRRSQEEEDITQGEEAAKATGFGASKAASRTWMED